MNEYIIDIEAGKDLDPESIHIPFEYRHGVDLTKLNELNWKFIPIEELDGLKVGDQWQHDHHDEIYTILCFAEVSGVTCAISTTYKWCGLETLKECLIT